MTEADVAGDVHSLDRKLEQRLLLLLKSPGTYRAGDRIDLMLGLYCPCVCSFSGAHCHATLRQPP